MGSTTIIGEYIRLCAKRYKWLIAAVAAIGIGTFIITFIFSSTIYEASTSLLIETSTGAQTLEDKYRQTQLTKEVAKNCVGLATSSTNINQALKAAKSDLRASEFAKNVHAEVVEDSSVIRITVKYKNSDVQAMALAQGISKVVQERIDERFQAEGAAEPEYRAVINETAGISSEVNRIVPALTNGLIAFVIAVLGFLIYQMVAVAADKTIRGHEKITRSTQRAVIAAIPSVGRGAKDAGDVSGSKVGNAYRILRSAVKYAKGSPKSIAVCSPAPKDGRTSVAVGLASALAETNAMVLLIEADMRRPSMKMQLRVDSPFGLADLLLGKTNLATTICKTANRNLYAITAASTSNLSNIEIADLLDSDVMDELLEAVYSQFDYVIIDTPAAELVPDATSVSGKVDGCLLVCQYGRTHSDDLASTLEVLEGTGARVLGIVTTNSSKKGFLSQGNNYYTQSRTLERRAGL
ncbi:MAG: polysaccharide biosynthesis tyrosine autokinase [Oscillospiraceae bacterium]|jgi:capsular exopolysaccharide synthesis family protein|nr:polysaccharide biosynthesis tyrosine autokinase [Oscillospiraceae bacterium]